MKYSSIAIFLRTSFCPTPSLLFLGPNANLQGGPGASSLFGMLTENGPYLVNATNGLNLNPYSWAQNYSMIFIDNPRGTGYSTVANAKCVH